MPSIHLQSSDAETFKVDVNVASKSITIKTMLDDLGLEGDDETPVPLPNVDGKTLKKVIEWCTKHKDGDDQKIPDVGNLSLGNGTNDATQKKEEASEDGWTPDDLNLEKMESWDKDFYNVSQSEVFDILLAANYLDIKCLYKAGCKTVAIMIKECKSPEEIRQKFNCENDFTAEEEQKIREENEWCMSEKF